MIWVPIGAGILALLLSIFSAGITLKADPGEEKVKEISEAIKESALAFLNREYSVLGIFVIIAFVILGLLGFLTQAMSPWAAVAFIFGSISSMTAGYLGMNIAIRANGRTTVAVKESLNSGLRVAFRGGTVMGMAVVGIGLLGLCILYIVFHKNPAFLSIIPAYGMGASSVALFARIGGGIYTKGADAAADLVGKVEEGIPEDDPRNAAVIADFVGDNVGDVAGMGADLFESYVDSIIATITLAAVVVSVGLVLDNPTAWFIPLLVASGGIVASTIGTFFVRTSGEGMGALLRALRGGTFISAGLALLFSWLAIYFLNAGIGVFLSVLCGLVAGVIIGESTNYYTSYQYKPTRAISNASQGGGGTTVIQGFANGLMSTWIPLLVVAIALILAYKFSNFYGVAVAGVGMLSTLGISLATDAYGPIADNAGGIVEMSELGEKVREKTDALDSLGNTTAATGKGFAIGSAALTALALMLSYAFAAGIAKVGGGGQILIAGGLESSFLSAQVVGGLFIGALVPAIFCAMVMESVRANASVIVDEVRRQFREITGLREGKAKPDYTTCVDLSTKGALKRMVIPVIISIFAPLAVGFILGKYALGGFLLGSIGTGFMLAVAQANAGGSWDNAKKWIELGHLGGKGSAAHKAAVVGDTVGDAMKDAAGPSLNIMLKLMSIIALVFAPLLAHF